MLPALDELVQTVVKIRGATPNPNAALGAALEAGRLLLPLALPLSLPLVIAALGAQPQPLDGSAHLG